MNAYPNDSNADVNGYNPYGLGHQPPPFGEGNQGSNANGEFGPGSYNQKGKDGLPFDSNSFGNKNDKVKGNGVGGNSGLNQGNGNIGNNDKNGGNDNKDRNNYPYENENDNLGQQNKKGGQNDRYGEGSNGIGGYGQGNGIGDLANGHNGYNYRNPTNNNGPGHGNLGKNRNDSFNGAPSDSQFNGPYNSNKMNGNNPYHEGFNDKDGNYDGNKGGPNSKPGREKRTLQYGWKNNSQNGKPNDGSHGDANGINGKKAKYASDTRLPENKNNAVDNSRPNKTHTGLPANGKNGNVNGVGSGQPNIGNYGSSGVSNHGNDRLPQNDPQNGRNQLRNKAGQTNNDGKGAAGNVGNNNEGNKGKRNNLERNKGDGHENETDIDAPLFGKLPKKLQEQLHGSSNNDHPDKGHNTIPGGGYSVGNRGSMGDEGPNIKRNNQAVNAGPQTNGRSGLDPNTNGYGNRNASLNGGDNGPNANVEQRNPNTNKGYNNQNGNIRTINPNANDGTAKPNDNGGIGNINAYGGHGYPNDIGGFGNPNTHGGQGHSNGNRGYGNPNAYGGQGHPNGNEGYRKPTTNEYSGKENLHANGGKGYPTGTGGNIEQNANGGQGNPNHRGGGSMGNIANGLQDAGRKPYVGKKGNGNDPTNKGGHEYPDGQQNGSHGSSYNPHGTKASTVPTKKGLSGDARKNPYNNGGMGDGKSLGGYPANGENRGGTIDPYNSKALNNGRGPNGANPSKAGNKGHDHATNGPHDNNIDFPGNGPGKGAPVNFNLYPNGSVDSKPKHPNTNVHKGQNARDKNINSKANPDLGPGRFNPTDQRKPFTGLPGDNNNGGPNNTGGPGYKSSYPNTTGKSNDGYPIHDDKSKNDGLNGPGQKSKNGLNNGFSTNDPGQNGNPDKRQNNQDNKPRKLISFRNNDPASFDNDGNPLPTNRNGHNASNDPYNKGIENDNEDGIESLDASGGRKGPGHKAPVSNFNNPAGKRAWKHNQPNSNKPRGTQTPVKHFTQDPRRHSLTEPDPVIETDRLGKKFPFLNPRHGSTGDDSSAPSNNPMRKIQSDSNLPKKEVDSLNPRNGTKKAFPDQPDTLTSEEEKQMAKEFAEMNPGMRDKIFYGFGVGRWRKFATAWLNKWKMKKKPIKTVDSEWDG